MRWMRGPAAMLTFLIGFLLLAAGIVVTLITLALGPADPDALTRIAAGVVLFVVGLAFLWISRAIDGDRGPVKDYRERRRKPKA